MKTEEGWGEAERLDLIEEGLSLDGCPYVSEEEIWFCSVRKENHREIDLWIANISDGVVSNIRNAGERLNLEVGLGEHRRLQNRGRHRLHRRLSQRSGPPGVGETWRIFVAKAAVFNHACGSPAPAAA